MFFVRFDRSSLYYYASLIVSSLFVVMLIFMVIAMVLVMVTVTVAVMVTVKATVMVIGDGGGRGLQDSVIIVLKF